MKFETKALLIFTVIVVIGFIILNSVSFLYYKNSLELSLLREAKAYINLYKFDSHHPIPEYFKISNIKYSSEDLNFIPFFVDRQSDLIVYLDSAYVNNKYMSFYINILLWDIIIIILLFIFFHYTIIRYIQKEAQLRKTLEMSILAVSHKLGNFLAINKMNIEMLKEKCPEKEVERLLTSYNSMEKDFKHISTLLKEVDKNPQKKIINVKTLINKDLSAFRDLLKDKKLYIDLKDFYIRIDESKLHIVIQNLIENAVKFSKEKIHIKMCVRKNRLVIFIRNDISDEKKHSTGIGLNIIQQIISDLNGKFHYRTKKDHYLTVLILYK